MNFQNFLFPFILFIFLTSCGNRNNASIQETRVSDPAKLILADINKKIEANPNNADLFDNRARYYMFESQFDLALKDINKAVTLSPNNPLYYLTLSDVYLLTGKPANSGDALKKALSLDPKNNQALLRMAKLNLIIREYKTSMEYIRKALDVDPVNPQAYFTKALVLLETGDTVKAVEDLKKAVDQNQNYFEALMELGELYSMKKDQMGGDYLKNALKIQPNSKEALYMLGMFYQETGKYDAALETYAKLSKIDTTFRDASYNSGYIYLVYLHDFRKAADFFTITLKRDPGYVEALFNRGYAYELSGEKSKAYQDYKHVLVLKTNYQKAIDGMNRIDKAGGK